MIVGIRIWGVKFHDEMSRREFVTEVIDLIAQGLRGGAGRRRGRRMGERSDRGREGRSRQRRLGGSDLANGLQHHLPSRRIGGGDRGASDRSRRRRLLGRRVGAYRLQEAGRTLREAMYRKTTLPSGLRVLTETMPAVRSVSIGIWADVGSSLEAHDDRGISHLVEHMLFKGTQRRSARAIAETMDGVGGNLNAFTDKEVDLLLREGHRSSRAAGDGRPRRHVLQLDLRCGRTGQRAEGRAGRDQDVRGLARRADPRSLLADDVERRESRRADDRIHRHGRAASRPTICARTCARHYAPNAVVVAAAGNLEHERFAELVEREFAAFGGACVPPDPEAPKTTPSRLIRHKDSEQAYVVVGTRGLSVRDERRYALSLLDTLLGGGMSSRLFQEIREKRGLVYTVYSFQAAYRGAGLFGVYAGTSPENVQSYLDLVSEQFAKVRNLRVDSAELRLAKEHIKGNLTLSLESTSSRMIRLGRNEFALGRHVTPEEIEQRIDAVTAGEVQELAGELLAEENLGLCVIGPVDESAIAWNRDAA